MTTLTPTELAEFTATLSKITRHVSSVLRLHELAYGGMRADLLDSQIGLVELNEIVDTARRRGAKS